MLEYDLSKTPSALSQNAMYIYIYVCITVHGIVPLKAFGWTASLTNIGEHDKVSKGHASSVVCIRK